MSENSTIQVVCPQCGVAFEVPSEYAGMDAQCSECQAIFPIPKPIAEKNEDALKTQTVRLKRIGSNGMLPQVPDEKYKIKIVPDRDEVKSGKENPFPAEKSKKWWQFWK